MEQLYDIFRNYIEDSAIINDNAYDYGVSVIHSEYTCNKSTYTIKNDFNVIQKINMSYILEEDNTIKLYEVWILGEYGNYIDTPFNIFNEAPFILFADLVLYIEWFSQLDKTLPILPTTPPP